MNTARFRYRLVVASQGAPKLHDDDALLSGIRRPVSSHLWPLVLGHKLGARLDDTIAAAPASAAYKQIGRPFVARATPDGDSHISVYA